MFGFGINGIGNAVGGACNMGAQIIKSVTSLVEKPLNLIGDVINIPISSWEANSQLRIEENRHKVRLEYERQLAFQQAEIENYRRDSELARQSKILQAIQEYQKTLTELNVWTDETLGKNLNLLHDEIQASYVRHCQAVHDILSKKQDEVARRQEDLVKLCSQVPEALQGKIFDSRWKLIDEDLALMIKQVNEATKSFNDNMNHLIMTIDSSSAEARRLAGEILISQARDFGAGNILSYNRQIVDTKLIDSRQTVDAKLIDSD